MISRADPSLLARWLRQTDMLLLGLLLMLFGLGMALIGSVSPAMAHRIGVDESFFLFRHARLLPAAIGLMLLISALSQRTLVQASVVVALPLLLVLMVLTILYGQEIKGAQRWLYIMGVSLQPSEAMKPVLIASIGAFLSAEKGLYRLPGTALTLAAALLVSTLLWLQPDVGQSILILAIVYVQLFVAGTAWRLVILFPLILFVVLGLSYVLFPHAQDRINDFMFSNGVTGYQLGQAQKALINGGWLGEGLGMGTVKPTLPDAHTDFVFAVVAEELGGITMIAILFVLMTITGIGVWRSITAIDLRQQVVTAGVLTHLLGQTLINAGSMLHLIPATGITVPFLSYGGSSMLATSASAGLLLAFNRRGVWVLGGKR